MKIKIEVGSLHVRLEQSAITRYLSDIGEKTQAIMVQQAAAPKSGRVYIVRGAAYTASAPGEFPANKFGHLSRSYRYSLGASDVMVGTDIAVYPAYLRAGTRKMAPRLFLQEAIGFAAEIEHFRTSFVVFAR